MNGIAHVTIVGRLAANPDLRRTQDGRAVARFRVAVNRGRKTAEDRWEEQTDWFSVTAFGAVAERAAERLARGQRAFVGGRLETRLWEGAEGPRTSLDVIASEIVPLDRPEPRQALPAEAADAEEAALDSDDLPF